MCNRVISHHIIGRCIPVLIRLINQFTIVSIWLQSGAMQV
nr:MAG TPA: hypothetical protein [Caudoviricetes sp.]